MVTISPILQQLTLRFHHNLGQKLKSIRMITLGNLKLFFANCARRHLLVPFCFRSKQTKTHYTWNFAKKALFFSFNQKLYKTECRWLSQCLPNVFNSDPRPFQINILTFACHLQQKIKTHLLIIHLNNVKSKSVTLNKTANEIAGILLSIC